MAINKDIKDKVYIDGQWIDDFYLTQEKNEELKNLRSDLTKSVEELSSGINGNTSNISILDQAINFETDRAKEAEANLQTAIEEETSARTQADETLQTNITTETNNRIAEDEKLQQNVNTTQTNIDNLKTYSDNTFQTKIDAFNEHTTLSEQITSEVAEAVNDLTNEINEKITGVNKWVGPVDTVADLPTNLDPDYTYLCKVIEEEATYQLIARTSEWKLYSSIKDYVDSNELTTAINEHNNSETSHNDIRQELETLSEVVDSLSGGTATDLTDIKDRLSTAESDIDTLQSEAHTHTNKDLLDTYTQTEVNLADAVTKKHEHLNKTILDNTTASYTEEEKEKLSSLNSDNYEKISNKVTEINETANNTTYPTSEAVKNYVDNNQSSVDTSDLVTLNTPQVITGGKVFTNFYISDGGSITNQFITSQNGDLSIISSVEDSKFLVNSIDVKNLYYNGIKYGLYGVDNISDNYILVTKDYIDDVLSSQSTSGSFNYCDYIVNIYSDLVLLNNINEGSVAVVLHDNEGEYIDVPISYVYTNGIWDDLSKSLQLGLFYSYNYINVSGLFIYGVSANNKAIQIYPTNIPNLTLTQDGITLGTYTGESDISINIPKQDLSNYVTNTSLTNTLSNYITTTNLNESLDDYLLKSGGTLTGNLTLVASQSYIAVGSYNILGDNGVYYFVGNEVKPLELRGNDLRPTYRVGETDSVESIALVSDLSDYVLTSDLDNYVSTTSLTSTLQSYATTTQLNTKLNSNQGTTNAGKVLIVGDDGNITFTNYASVQEDGTIIFEASL